MSTPAQRVIGYVRVSTDEQHDNGGGLDAQRQSIRDECARRGYELIDIIGEDEGLSGKEIDRPGLNRARDAMDAGEADILMISKLDRLSRNTWQGLQFIDQAGRGGKQRNGKRKRKGWSVVTAEANIDTTTSTGMMMTTVMLGAAQYERQVIGDRTRAGMAAKKAAGTLKGPIGRPQSLTDQAIQRILHDRQAGLSFGKIAKNLTDEQIPTAHGGQAWYPSTIKRICESEAAKRLYA
jgi:DNA invertase Pin-like site-specific DNA recombinase